jgi:hypothetical protein
MPAAAPITAAEYLAHADETRRTQLVDGVVVVDEPLRLHHRAVLGIALPARTRRTVRK